MVRLRNYLGKRLFRLAQKLSVDSLGGSTLRATLSVISPQLKPDELVVSPSNPYARDLLGREPFGEGLSRLVNYGAGTGVVLIDADWGSGKTTFLKMWIQHARNDGKVVALVNAWDGDYRGSPLKHIAEQLARELERYVPRNFFTSRPSSFWATPRNPSTAHSCAISPTPSPGSTGSKQAKPMSRLQPKTPSQRTACARQSVMPSWLPTSSAPLSKAASPSCAKTRPF